MTPANCNTNSGAEIIIISLLSRASAKILQSVFEVLLSVCFIFSTFYYYL